MVGPFSGNSAVHQEAFVNQDGTSRAAGTGPGGGTGGGGQRAAGAAGAAAGAGGGGGGGGGRAQPPGDAHNGSGTAVAGGRTQVVHAGDVIMIPAGVPHHWTKVDQPIVYLDIKFPKPAPAAGRQNQQE